MGCGRRGVRRRWIELWEESCFAIQRNRESASLRRPSAGGHRYPDRSYQRRNRLHRSEPQTFDWNRSSPEQIRKLFQAVYPEICDQIRGWIVNELIRQRTDTKFDFSKAVVKKILETLKDGLQKMYQVHLDIDRLHLR